MAEHRRSSGSFRRLLRRFRGHPIAVLLLGGLLGLGMLGSFDRGTPSVSAQSLETREQELAEIRQQIERLRDRVVAMRSKESTIEDRLSRVSTELELQQVRVDEANAALDLATRKAETMEQRVASTELALGAVKEDLRRRLTGLYVLGRRGYLRLFLSVEADDDVLSALRQLRYLVRRDEEAIAEHARLRDELKEQQRALEAERREMAGWQQQEAERRDQLRTIERQRRQLLDQVTAERRRLAARATELEDKERKLLAFVDGLVDSTEGSLGGSPIQEFRGVLDWPIRGRVVQEFGPKKDPRYRTEVPHNGLELETETGTKVRVVYPGEVVYAGPFEGYGPMVVTQHAGRVFTLYAGLELLSVGRGDVLSLGDVIGASAERLYFEIRVENQPEDPRQWLR